MLFFVVFMLISCIEEVTRLSVAPAYPDADDIRGTYSVHWRGSVPIDGVGAIGDAVGYLRFPCGGLDEIGGSYEYDPLDGSLVAELKSLDGTIKLVVSGGFARGDTVVFGGEFQVYLLAIGCDGGAVTMEQN